MSDSTKPADENTSQEKGETPAKSPKPVDTAAQEDAAKDRKGSGGYN